MAQVILGIGTSHAPQLSMLPEHWHLRAEWDQRNPHLLADDGNFYTYDELLERASPLIAKEITPEKFQQRHEANQRAIASLSETLEEVSPDVLVMVGDDQQEVLRDDNMPAICIYWGDTVPDRPHNRVGTGSGEAAVRFGYAETERTFPGSSDLGRHLIEYLVEAEFDVGHSRFLREGQGIGHAFGFVYNRLMGRKVVPTVPIMLNTYYPPNQPTPKRCYDLGRTLRSAIEAWPGKARVGVLASGGLSHFVVDEELDEMAMDGIKNNDVVKLSRLPRERLHSGNSEIRNWIVLAGATEHLMVEWIDYVPCYRSAAGTGCSMAFARWR